jgi:hypothetical protein
MLHRRKTVTQSSKVSQNNKEHWIHNRKKSHNRERAVQEHITLLTQVHGAQQHLSTHVLTTRFAQRAYKNINPILLHAHTHTLLTAQDRKGCFKIFSKGDLFLAEIDLMSLGEEK